MPPVIDATPEEYRKDYEKDMFFITIDCCRLDFLPGKQGEPRAKDTIGERTGQVRTSSDFAR